MGVAPHGEGYRARPWVGPRQGDNWNLGYFGPNRYGWESGWPELSLRDAAYAVRRFLSLMSHNPRPDPWAVIQRLQGERRWCLPVVPLHILPRWVVRDGDGFRARVRIREGGVVRLVQLPELFADPGAAHAAMALHLEARRQRRRNDWWSPGRTFTWPTAPSWWSPGRTFTWPAAPAASN